MEEPIEAGLTPAEGRKFAFTLAAAFLVLSGAAWRRGQAAAAMLLGGIGGVLLLAGLLVPERLGPVRRAWMRIGRGLSGVTTPLFMGIVYFGVLTPLGLLMRLAGRRVLVHRAGESGYWIRRTAGQDRTGGLERQF